jgi:hypothetical protein
LSTNPPIRPQAGPQAALLACPIEEVFFGGARGGGKSYGSILDFHNFTQEYGKIDGIVFRRTFPELEQYQKDCQEILPPLGYRYQAGARTWTGPSGSSLKLRYLDRDKDAGKYQGHSYQWMCFDEAGEWPSMDPIKKLKGALRGGKFMRFLLTGNPGGIGHNWLKSRYIDPASPYTPIAETQPDGNVSYRVFIPSLVDDNQELLKKDPDYRTRLYGTGPEWLVKAWLNGNWNIVAGGMFDDVWSNKCIIPPFEIPDNWDTWRAFDWGSSAPFATVWLARANGETDLPKGSIVVFAEDYGWNGQPNQGLRLTVTEIAERIKRVERSWKNRVRPGPADSAIFTRENGASIADDFDKSGVRWEACDKGPGSRVNGWQKIRDLLSASGQKEKPGLYFFETCRQLIRTIPGLPRDTRKIDDVDTDAEDHLADALRYGVTSQVRKAETTQISWG